MNFWNVLAWVTNRWEKILFYLGLLGLVLFLQALRSDLAGFSHRLLEDTRFLQSAPRAPVVIDAKWVDLLTQRASQRAVPLALPMRDLFSIVQENTARPARQDAQALPSPDAGRVSLVKIYRQAVRLLFKGYLRLPDGSYSLQINWAGQTDFKRLGESIRGYRIEKFQKVIGSEVIQGGYTREADNSYVVIHKESEAPVTLEKGRLVSEKELFAKVFDAQSNVVVTVHVGSALGEYKVLDITEDEVLLSNEANEKTVLKRAR